MLILLSCRISQYVRTGTVHLNYNALTIGLLFVYLRRHWLPRPRPVSLNKTYRC